jgi:hypothetical protein
MPPERQSSAANAPMTAPDAADAPITDPHTTGVVSATVDTDPRAADTLIETDTSSDTPPRTSGASDEEQPGAAEEPPGDGELLCTFCGLRACWTS